MTWPLVPLGEIAAIERRTVQPATLGPETPYLGLEHIERGGKIIGRDTVAGAKLASTKFTFTHDHVLYGKLRPNLGKVSLPDFTGVCSTDILPIRPGIHLDRRYLHYYLTQPSMVRFAATRTSGANLPRLSPTTLETFLVPLPPLEEQRRIAAMLDQADAIRTKRRQALAHLDTLTQSIFHSMFSKELAGEHHIELNSIATLSAGRSLVAKDSSTPSPYRVLKISAVTSGVYRPAESKPLPVDYVPPSEHLVRSGDLLMSRANTADLVGACAFVNTTPSNLALPDKVWRFDWHDRRSNPLYYHALFRMPQIRRSLSKLASGTGGSMKNISKAKLEKLRLPAISFSRQNQFAEVIRSIDANRLNRTKAQDGDDELFASLQSRAFKGEL